MTPEQIFGMQRANAIMTDLLRGSDAREPDHKFVEAPAPQPRSSAARAWTTLRALFNPAPRAAYSSQPNGREESSC